MVSLNRYKGDTIEGQTSNILDQERTATSEYTYFIVKEKHRDANVEKVSQNEVSNRSSPSSSWTLHASAAVYPVSGDAALGMRRGSEMACGVARAAAPVRPKQTNSVLVPSPLYLIDIAIIRKNLSWMSRIVRECSALGVSYPFVALDDRAMKFTVGAVCGEPNITELVLGSGVTRNRSGTRLSINNAQGRTEINIENGMGIECGSGIEPDRGTSSDVRSRTGIGIRIGSGFPGVSHDRAYVLFRLGRRVPPAVRQFAEAGRADGLGSGPGTFDTFGAPAVTQGAGRTEAEFFVDGNHSRGSACPVIKRNPYRITRASVYPSVTADLL
ncbi:hypothetical protein EVAR_48320_1 [Eumeta japonica]|uniref:Spondin domain-containing protein n=1 Tax=Eumeta variegata TaxID=151549 RepID=A0A4C1WNK9_EUMVA|nr:hypothetical protein EVAR_48320_1 [Eumeta japonica]